MRNPELFTVKALMNRWRLKSAATIRQILKRNHTILSPVKIGGHWLVSAENVLKFETGTVEKSDRKKKAT